MKTILRLSLLLQIAGSMVVVSCLGRSAIDTQSFSIDPPASQFGIAPKGVIVTLARVEVAPPYSGQALVYRTGKHGLGRDPYARFVAPPSWLLTAAIRGYLLNADFVRDVKAPGAGSHSTIVVEVAVSKLEGELGPGGSSALLTLRFRVLSDPGGVRERSEILLKTYSKAVSMSRATAGNIVDGWNVGLAQIMAEFQGDLRSSLDAAGVPISSGGSPKEALCGPTRS